MKVEKRKRKERTEDVYYKAYVGEKAEDIWIDVANYIEDNYKEEDREDIHSRRWGTVDKRGIKMDIKIKVCTRQISFKQIRIKSYIKEPKYRDKIWRAINEGIKKE